MDITYLLVHHIIPHDDKDTNMWMCIILVYDTTTDVYGEEWELEVAYEIE